MGVSKEGCASEEEFLPLLKSSLIFPYSTFHIQRSFYQGYPCPRLDTFLRKKPTGEEESSPCLADMTSMAISA